jgi:Raf kinase inhibitor-like YbhB/YbcL family protein
MLRMLATAIVVAAVSAGPMQVGSGDIAAGHAFPIAFMARGCGGENRSPSLAWSGAPPTTQSFAIIMHDPDAPMPGGFYHWVAYNLPSTMRGLATDVVLTKDQLGQTSTGGTGYHGPCPPPGAAHHYNITVYALDISNIAADAPLTAAQLELRIDGHVLARGTFQATASRQ